LQTENKELQMTQHSCKGPVLIVEDDSNTAALVQTYLERDGFQTILAADGETALRLARADAARADLPFIFERFFRAERSRSRDAGGAGIGLSITKELVEAHGGRVGAESTAGTTSVWLTLPTG
jgi:light-regulated signal transduction histidine kinase (bacteriophytochrome)